MSETQPSMDAPTAVPTDATTDAPTDAPSAPVPRVVIIAVDMSHTAEHAFEWYAEHLHRPENKVIVMNSVEIGHVHAHPSMFATPEQYNYEIQVARRHAQAMEERFNTLLNAHEMDGHFELHQGKPGECVVSAANKHRAECIVIGTRGQGTVRRTILGSVSDYVVHHAHCAVVTVRKNVPI